MGRARQGNEDNYFRGRTVFAVADGMGGHSHGEIASDMAVQPLEAIDGRAFASAQEAEQALVEAVRARPTRRSWSAPTPSASCAGWVPP